MEESSFTLFVQRYKGIMMSHNKLKVLWRTIDDEDFDENNQEAFEWFQKYRKECIEEKKKTTHVVQNKPYASRV